MSLGLDLSLRLKPSALSVRSLLGMPLADANGLIDLAGWASNRNSDTVVTDFEDIQRTLPPYTIPWGDGRIPKNIVIGRSEDLTDSNWLVNNVTKDSSTQITFTALNGALSDYIVTKEGGIYIFSFYVQNIDGNTNLRCQHLDSATGFATAFTCDSTLRRYSFEIAGRVGGGTVKFGITDNNASGHGSIILTKIQLEEVTGQAITAPSEYVPVGTAVGSELKDNYNGSNLGTECSWVDQPTDFSFDDTTAARQCSIFYDESLTLTKQYVIQYEIYDHVSGDIRINITASGSAFSGSPGTYSQDGIYTEVLTCDDISAGRGIVFRINAAGGIAKARLLSLKEASTGIAIYATENDNTVDANGVVTEIVGDLLDPAPHIINNPERTNKCENYNLNPTDTTGVTKSGDVAATLTLVDDSANYPDELKQRGNQSVFKLDNSGGSANATADIDGTAGNTETHICQCYAAITTGTGKLRLSSDAGSDVAFIGSAYALYETVPLAAIVSSKTRIIANAGAVIYFIANQLEQSSFVTPIIETSGGTADRSADETRHAYSSSVFNQDEGMLIFDWVPEYDKAAGVKSLIYPGAASSILYLQGADGSIASWDGTTITTVPESYVNGNRYIIGLRWSKALSEIQVGVKDVDGDGLWAWDTPPEAYDDEYTFASYLELFKVNPAINQLHDLKIYNKDKGTDFIEANF